MRVEFNGKGFSSDMESSYVGVDVDMKGIEGCKSLVKANTSLIFGMVSFIISLVNLPFALFMNFSAELLGEVYSQGLPFWTSVLFVFASVMLTLSVVLGVFSIVAFAKSTKRASDNIGLALSIVSFVVCVICLALNIIGIVAW